MLDIQEVRRINTAKAVRDRFGGVNKRLADRINELRQPDEGIVQASYITRILKSDASGARGIGDSLARRIEAAAGLSANTLDHLAPEDYAYMQSDADTPKAPSPAAAGRASKYDPIGNARRQMGGLIPVISWVQAGSWAEIQDFFLPPDDYDYVEISEKLDSSQAIALTVENDSMWKPDDPKSFPPGCIIAVKRPDLRQIQSGDFVVARLENENRATFKQVIFDGDNTYLRPLNPAYPTIKVTSAAHYVGVVFEKIVKTRY